MSIRPSHIALLALSIILAPHLQGYGLLACAAGIGLAYLADVLHERTVMRLTALLVEQKAAEAKAAAAAKRTPL